MSLMKADSRIYVAGHQGMVGSALVRRLQTEGHTNILTATAEELDLRNQEAVRCWFEANRPEFVFLAAARVGGIQANHRHPAEFLYDNLMIGTNTIHQAYLSGATKLAFLGSSCVYPRECPQPIREEYLMTGPLEPTNEGYSLAKIPGIRMASFYNRQYGFNAICPMPCSLYGTNDNYHPLHSHVLPALIRRFMNATEDAAPSVTLWGTGTARREFLHVDDLARAVVFLMNEWDSPEMINVGAGVDYTIAELASMVASKVGYQGQILWDTSMPDGMPRRCLEVTKMTQLGFKPEISMEQGLDLAIQEYRLRWHNTPGYRDREVGR